MNFSTRFAVFQANMLVRMRNILVSTINKEKFLPKYIIFVIEDDLIKFMKNETNYKRALEWLMQEHIDILLKTKQIMPEKAKKEAEPKMLWILPSAHKNYLKNDERVKLGQQLIDLTADLSFIYALPLKQMWSDDNPALVNSRINRITEEGLGTLWHAVDRTARFWIVAEQREQIRKLVDKEVSKIQHDAKKQSATFTRGRGRGSFHQRGHDHRYFRGWGNCRYYNFKKQYQKF